MEPEDFDFSIPLSFDEEGSNALFLPDRAPDKKDTAWLKQTKEAIKSGAMSIDEAKKQAPTRTVLTALENQVNRYAGPMPGDKTGWQNYIMSRYFELSQDLDPRVSKPALDSLAKTSVVGLMETKVEVSVTTKSETEITSEALMLLRKIAGRESEEILDGDFEEL